MADTNDIHSRPYVEVYVWLAKDNDGCTTTSSEGGKLGSNLARCGHVSMEIFPRCKPSAYLSLWPGRDAPGVLIDSLEDDQSEECEGTRPDVIIRLHKLDVDAMLTAFVRVEPRVERGEISWDYKVSNSEDVTHSYNSRASCASFVYSFLKIGGFDNRASTYYNYVAARGPRNKNLYKITKCNAGELFWGIFNRAPWTGWVFSPKALLLRTASAMEGCNLDKTKTIEIMKSNRVAKEKEKKMDGNSGDS